MRSKVVDSFSYTPPIWGMQWVRREQDLAALILVAIEELARRSNDTELKRLTKLLKKVTQGYVVK